MDDLRVNDWLTIPSSELDWHAVRSGGPGGQNVNKVNTKVDLRFDLRGSTVLPGPVKARLRRLVRTRLDADGRVVIASATSRSQSSNLEDARERLRQFILQALVRPKVRKATKPTKGAKRRRLKAKKVQGDQKKMRKKVDY